MISLNEIKLLIEQNKIEEAQIQLAKLGSSYYQNPDYLYLRSKIFYLKKLYYIAIDTLLIALEFEQSDKIYNLIGKIYGFLDNNELSKKFLNLNLRAETAKSLKAELSGIYKKTNLDQS